VSVLPCPLLMVSEPPTVRFAQLIVMDFPGGGRAVW